MSKVFERWCRRVVRSSLLPKAVCLEGRCREVVRLNLLPKAAFLEGRCREVVRLNLLPKAALLEGRCREVVHLNLPPKASCLEGRCRGCEGGWWRVGEEVEVWGVGVRVGELGGWGGAAMLGDRLQ